MIRCPTCQEEIYDTAFVWWRTYKILMRGVGLPKMIAFIIKQNGEIKETFGYEIPFNETTRQSIVQYACANYGPDATIRMMTEKERADFILHGQRDSRRLYFELTASSQRKGV